MKYVAIKLAMVVVLSYCLLSQPGFSKNKSISEKKQMAYPSKILNSKSEKTVAPKKPPEVQVINNSELSIHSVKIGQVLFTKNLSKCFDGCSTPFKKVSKGQNRIYVKTGSIAPWQYIGVLDSFAERNRYSVNITKKGQLLCVWSTLNRNGNRKKLNKICKKVVESEKTTTVKPLMRKNKPFKPGSSITLGKDRYFIGGTRGIQVSEPQRRHLYPQGERMRVAWRDITPGDGADSESGNFLINIRQVGREDEGRAFYAGTTVARCNVSSPSFEVTIPEIVSNGRNYYIRVHDLDSEGVYGDSDTFQIGPSGANVEVILQEPPPCPHWVRDCLSSFRYRLGTPLGFTLASTVDDAYFEVETIELQPRYGDRGGYRSWPMDPIDTGGPFSRGTFEWMPPLDIETPHDYRIKVRYRFTHYSEHRLSTAYSEYIDLYDPWPPEPTYSISISRPVTGEAYSINDGVPWLNIDWTSSHIPDGVCYTIILTKGGVELQRFGPQPDSDKRKIFNVNGYESGGDYSVRIEAHRDADNEEGIFTPCEEFLASAETGHFTLNNTNWGCSEYYPLHVYEPGYSRDPQIIGEPLRIWWVSCFDSALHKRVRISLVREASHGGGEWEVASSMDASIDEITWVIPDDVPAGEGYRIRVEEIGGSAVAASTYTFSISAP